MFPLTEVIENADQNYLLYLSRKTGFMIPPKEERTTSYVHWFWYHLMRNIQQEQNFFKEYEKELICLFDNFGYISSTHITKDMKSMENKISWIFRHPSGGIFLPLEIFKVFMREKYYQNSGYLFSLLYQMSFNELKGMASFLGNTLDAQLAISFEKNTYDMALVLYIWFANRHMNDDVPYDSLEKKGRIIASYHFLREDQKSSLENQNKKQKDLFPFEKKPLWKYLFEKFPENKSEISELREMILRGKKGFYRSLSLISDENVPFIQGFRDGILIPIWKQSNKKMSLDEWLIQTPREIQKKIRESSLNSSRFRHL